MKKDIANKWVEALRSGEYKQDVGQLRIQRGDGFKYCCLGVLTDLHKKETQCNFSKESNEVWCGLIKESVYNWAGFSELQLLETENPKGFAQMNDGIGQPRQGFVEIADYIEKNWEVL